MQHLQPHPLLKDINMETWFILIVSLCVIVLIRAIFSTLIHSSSSKGNKGKTITNIPPGPPHIPIITSITWLRKSFSELEPILRGLVAKYGPIVTLRIGSRPAIFIADRSLAHRALIQHGSVFSDRPKALPTSKIFSSNQHNISSAAYGPTWRALRRNLTSEILHHSRVYSFSEIRKSVLQSLLTSLNSDSQSNHSLKIIDHLQYSMFCLLVFMCFGETLPDETVKEIERVQRQTLLNLNRFNILNFWPQITRILFRKRWELLLGFRKEQENVLIPLIRARKHARQSKLNDSGGVSYVDSLLDLELPEEKRKLIEREVVSLCSEFLDGGTDTTSTALQWLLANLVKYRHVQEKVAEEITDVMRDREDREVREEDLNKLKYLKAVILEGLRRHPPGHFVLPHAVTEDDVVLDGYLVPKNGTVNFMVAEMGLDPKVWEDPMTFKPERFMKDDGEGFDITSSKEIKMMPFGAGRRMCPGYNLAMLHLEYFVANLVWNFDWKVPEGGPEVDLSEKQEFTVVMKHPLQVHITPRF